MELTTESETFLLIEKLAPRINAFPVKPRGQWDERPQAAANFLNKRMWFGKRLLQEVCAGNYQIVNRTPVNSAIAITMRRYLQATTGSMKPPNGTDDQ